jgi:hypothetical protein
MEEIIMIKEKYEKLDQIKEKIIVADDLKNRTDRTLLYGYTCARDIWHVYIQNWHVYIQNNHIYTVIYEYDKEPSLVNINYNQDYIPDKRLYPECCDYEFCEILKRLDIHLPFTTWQDRPEQKQYWGKILKKEMML